MQAAGVLLFKNTEQLVEGGRVDERIKVLGLPGGDEAVRAELAPLIQDGTPGTQVRVQTLRRDNKKGVPKHTWSAAVLDQATCLVSLLSLEDPSRRSKLPPTDGAEIRVGDSTVLQVRSRHFLFNTDVKPNQVVPFETTEDVVIGDSIAVPAGSLVAAYMEQSSDIGDYGRGAKGQLRFKFLAMPDGTRVPLRGVVDLRGKGSNKTALIAATVVFGASRLSATGSGFAIPAGALFRAEVDGEQKVRVSRATAPAKGQD
jgi:hypothetical protein